MSMVIFLGGVPGSGKSTFASKLNLPVVSADNNRELLTGEVANFSMENEVWKLVYNQVAEHIANEQDFILDVTSANGPLRRQMLQFMRTVGYQAENDVFIRGIFLDISAAQAIRQNQMRERKVPDDVILKMQKSLMDDPPTLDDGFDNLEFLGPEFNYLHS